MKTKVNSMVNLSVNPCNMCMPMGAVNAFYGIKKCVSILHGSQGCSTYIRRHMATHFNEPVDIASSSLTEHGTVYGGEANLMAGLKNLIELYHPEVIGVSTTCLAETIGEDVPRIIDKFISENPEHLNITIIPVQSPGYGGSQYEGFFKALLSIVSNVSMDVTNHQKVNIITGMISPADTRWLKSVVKDFGLEAILLPDISDNLDGGYCKKYERLPSHGTSIDEIKTMAGARYTIEIGNVAGLYSPAKYLKDKYGVPYARLNQPVGLRDTDALLHLLSKLSSNEMTKEQNRKRSRFLDAMIDGHKYNGVGRAVVYGDPDFVVSMVRLCTENGVMPVLTATGTKCSNLLESLEKDIQTVAKRYFVKEYQVLTDIDFKKIEESVILLQANMMIGNSDGRRIEERLGLPLVRRSFPIHDRVGGQRLKMFGYEGSLSLLDEISNALLAKTETHFREELYEKYYNKDMEASAVKTTPLEKTKTHPCFNCGAGKTFARIHLPIAPKCNIQCNYCVRKFDCPNESRPGVTTTVLDPMNAFLRYKDMKEKMPNLTVVGIAGPGDALANFKEVKETLAMIKEYDADVTFCLSTNGLMLPTYVEELIQLGVSHVTVTLNAVDPKIAGKIYHHIDFMGTRFFGENAGAILLSNQLAGIRMLTSRGIICKVNIVMLKGINDDHIPDVVEKVKELGCYITNIMPMIPVKGSTFEHIEKSNNKELMELRDRCGETMKQMYHCKQCRADAVGLLEHDKSIELKEVEMLNKNRKEAEAMVKGEDNIFRFAVASKSGMIIDQHFGHATEFYIYEYKRGNVTFIEQRGINKYCAGNDACEDGTDKIVKVIDAISDCMGVIAMRIGDSPKKELENKGIHVYSTYDKVEEAVKKAGDYMFNEKMKLN